MATRLFWHNALFDTAAFPGSYPINVNGGTAPTVQAHLTPLNYNVVDATSVHRSMDIQKGTSEVTKTMTSLANVASQTYYWSKFISNPLTGISSISANTWQLVYAFAESNLSANFIGPIIYLYVWRPSNGTRVGWINDQVNPADITEPGAINSERLKKTTFPGSAVSSILDGDVLIWELCSRLTQAASVAYQDSFYFDGTNEYTAGSTGNVVTDMAAYIETPQNLTFQSPTIDAVSDYKDIKRTRTLTKV
jgi:hypothetical protein